MAFHFGSNHPSVALWSFRKYQKTLEKTPVIEHGCRKEFFNTGDFENYWGKNYGCEIIQDRNWIDKCQLEARI